MALLDSSQINLSNPGAIGSIIPNTGRFTNVNGIKLSSSQSTLAITPGDLPISTGFNWIALGFESGYSNTTGGNWTAIGVGSGKQSTTGTSWTAIGITAGRDNSTGDNWTAIGGFAGQQNTTGNNWTAIGVVAGAANKTGNNWTAIGGFAGFNNITGSNWTAIGFNAGRDSNTSNGMFLGFEAGRFEANNNRLHIANNSSESLIYGEFDNKVVRINGRLSASLMLPGSYTTSTLPSPIGIAGTIVYNTSINKLVLSNGTTWETIMSS